MAGSHVSSPTRNYGQPSINTAFAEETNRGTGKYHVVQFNVTTADLTGYLTAPCTGKLARAELISYELTDGTNYFTVTATNESNSAVEMFTRVTNVAGGVLAANTASAITLSTTAANLLVDEGDNIKIVYDEANGAAVNQVTLTLYFETL